MTKWLACLLLLLPAIPARAHPHVFVDTTLRLSLDSERQLTGIEVTWAYDALFSLLILEDMGLDADGDGVLAPDELEQVQRFDLDNWPEDFEGDLYLRDAEGRSLALGAPEGRGVQLIDGQLVSVHYRDVAPTPAEGVEIRQFDPAYYVAYEVSGGVALPEPCRAEVEAPDTEAAERAVDEELAQVPEDQFELLEVGKYYAERITLTCAPSS